MRGSILVIVNQNDVDHRNYYALHSIGFILSNEISKWKWLKFQNLNFRIFELDHYDLHKFVSYGDYATGKTSLTDIQNAVVKKAAMNV